MRSYKYPMLSLILALLLGLSILTPAFGEDLPASISEQVRMIVGFKEGLIRTQSEQMSVVSRYGGQVQRQLRLINGAAVTMTKEEAEAFADHPSVAFIEPDIRVYPMEEQTVPWGVDYVFGEESYVFPSWEVSSGAGIGVAVLDTGIDGSHVDLPLLMGGVNTADLTPWDSDVYGHGTHVAGTIAALDNLYGVVGVAPAASLYAVKVFDDNGDGYLSDIIEGIEWAVTYEIPIISMSLGSTEHSEAFELACQSAYEAGHLLVAAAGNDHNLPEGQSNVLYPAAYDTVIAVSASNEAGELSDFSSTGYQVELMAPGEWIYSTIPGDVYGYSSGTSMAAPHVTAIAALIWSANPELTNVEVRTILRESATDMGLPADYQGYGFVRGDLALDQLSLIPLTLSNFTASNKIYDGTTEVLEAGFSDDRILEDELEFSYTVTFEDAQAGLDKTVSFSDIVISGGADRYKYVLTNMTGSAIASISQAALTISVQDEEIIYGDAPPDFSMTYEGFVGEEDETVLHEMASELVCTYEAGSPPGSYPITIAAFSADAPNYSWTLENGALTVNTKNLTVDGTFIVSDKIYDGTTTAQMADNLLTLSGILYDDEVSLANVTIAFDSAEAGTDKVVRITSAELTGAAIAYYTLSLEGAPTGTATISNPAPPPPPPPSGGGGGMMIPPPSPITMSLDDTPLLRSAKTEDIREGTQEGVMITPSTRALLRILKDMDEPKAGDEPPMLSIALDEPSNLSVLRFEQPLIRALTEKNIVIRFITSMGAYELPALEIFSDEASDEDSVQLMIRRLTKDELAILTDNLSQAGMVLVEEPVQFTAELFSEPVKREILLSSKTDLSPITTAVLCEPDGSFTHIPVKIVEEKKTTRISLYSRTSGIYALVSHELTLPAVESHWSMTQVNRLASRLIIEHPADFTPDSPVTRGEFASWITRALGLFRSSEGEALLQANAQGILNGYPDGSFRPEALITREEAMTMYARAMRIIHLQGTRTDALSVYTDLDQVSDWALPDVTETVRGGVFAGRTAHTLNPKETFTRAEAATAIYNLLNQAGFFANNPEAY